MEELFQKKEFLEKEYYKKLNEVEELKNKISSVQSDIYRCCEHDFKRHVETCAYPETYYICSKCGYELGY
tara:strand:+ start:89 stop:298 length:210 start_codon:yes stop_codon:yes gene_type:complete